VTGILEIMSRFGPQRILAMGAVTLALIGFFAFLMIRMSQPPMGVIGGGWRDQTPRDAAFALA
jgi:flagellar M-ring protein FliF